MEGLGCHLQEDAVLQTLTSDVLKTSEIEGETLDAKQVRSSIARRLGMDIGRTDSMDVTPWMEWFLGCLGRAIEGAQATLAAVLSKARVWESLAGIPLNQRQRLMINRLLDGLRGKLSTVKWAKLTKCSHDTALRDIQDLVARGVLVRNPGGGRSTSYWLAPDAD